jgi:hypothetical protein
VLGLLHRSPRVLLPCRSVRGDARISQNGKFLGAALEPGKGGATRGIGPWVGALPRGSVMRRER